MAEGARNGHPARRIAVVTNTPPNTYSGGRYHALMLAECLALGGHEVHYVTDHEPIFLPDLTVLPAHDKIRIHYTLDFKSALPEATFDLVFVVPGTTMRGFYRRAIRFARSRGARLALLNFESGNWFNAISPFPRDLAHWRDWQRTARYCSLILSSARESDRWARDFYTDVPKGACFDFAHAAINTVAADAVPETPAERRILLFARFAQAAHKGGNHITDLLCEAMREHTLVIVTGSQGIPDEFLAAFRQRAAALGITLEMRERLSDREKFQELKRARLLLFPSYFEGYGYPPLEAQYCGTPCVAFDLPVLRETCGDLLRYVPHGDWDAFRDETQAALASEDTLTGLRENAHKTAAPEAMAKRLNEVVEGTMALPPLSYGRLGLTHRLRDALERVSPRELRQDLESVARLPKRAVSYVRHQLLARPSRRPGRCRGVFCYYPPFDTMEDLNSHYHRACWYLPRVEKACERVHLFHTLPEGEDIPGPRPDYMVPSPSPTDHISVSRGKGANLLRLLTCRVVLLWRPPPGAFWLSVACRLLGVRLVNIATDDPEAKEYGEYARLIWRHGFTSGQQRRMLYEGRRVFARAAEEIRAHNYGQAVVAGTGPSLEQAEAFDFSDCLTIVCNSIVQNRRLLGHLRPRFVCAGDAVSHLGVSTYAAKFREDLLRAMDDYDLYFVSTASFSSVLLFHYPRLRDRLILLDQEHRGPNFDLEASFSAPMLDSTLNIHMLPLAATFTDTIWLLGCDGKSETRDNEDFWAHAKKAQYNELVDTGHLCHPTFDQNRQKSTYQRFLDSVEETVTTGEREYGKRYGSLMPSNVPTLRQRALDSAYLAAYGPESPCPVEALRPPLEPESPPQSHRAENAEDAPTAVITRCEIDTDSIIVVAGYVRASTPIERVEIGTKDKVLGRAFSGLFHPTSAPDSTVRHYGFVTTLNRRLRRGTKMRMVAYGPEGPVATTQRKLR